MSDWSTGHVFREWTVDRRLLVRGAGEYDWSRLRPCPPSASRAPPGSRGPRSLVDTAISVIANNIGDVPSEYLGALPMLLRRRIWRLLEARGGVCLHAWKFFSKDLLREDDERKLGLYCFREQICFPSDELKNYKQPMTSLSIDFITHLVISGGCDFDTHELLCLTDVKNLGVLELIRPVNEADNVFPRVNDRLIRGWTEMEDPFPLLRVLRIWGHQSTTQGSLRFVTKFPRLALYDVLGSREDWSTPRTHAMTEGWEMSVGSPRDSLLRDLMLFATLEKRRSHGPEEWAETVHRDLMSLCNDSRCPVRLHVNREAPSLLDYLTDTAKADAHARPTDATLTSSSFGSCHFEPWAFWLYSLIGQLSRDDDMTSRGVEANVRAVVGPFLLPSRPFASLVLGDSGPGGLRCYPTGGRFPTIRHTFIRSANRFTTRAELRAPQRAGRDEAGASQRGGLTLRKQERRRMDDVLQSFM